MLDNQQQVVATYRYDPFGVLLAQTGTLDQPYGFSTKRYDPDIGMIQYEYRPYFPAIGSWTTRDPLGEAGGMNLYAFVGNNPVNWVDPWGLLQKNPDGTFVTKFRSPVNVYTHHGYEYYYLPVFVFADDGTPIEAGVFIEGPEEVRNECYGYAFTDGQYKFSEVAAAKIIEHDNYTLVPLDEKPQVGDIVIYKEGGKIKHAAVVNKVGWINIQVRQIAGIGIDVEIKNINKAWPNPATIEIYHYNSP